MKKFFYAACLCWMSQAIAQTPSHPGHIAPDFHAFSNVTEAAFSPDEGAEALVIKVIDRADVRLRLAAYSFTSATVVRALVQAKRRGVDVKVMVDEKGNERKANIAALNTLVHAGIPTRTVSAYAIHHDKFIVADGRHVQTGSFNYSNAAARSNSENVLVVWGNMDLAAQYERHWNSRWLKAQIYRVPY